MPRSLSAAEALRVLGSIERGLESFVRTAPCAVARLGGIDFLSDASEMTCVGPIPRLEARPWEMMAREHAEKQRLEACAPR